MATAVAEETKNAPFIPSDIQEQIYWLEARYLAPDPTTEDERDGVFMDVEFYSDCFLCRTSGAEHQHLLNVARSQLLASDFERISPKPPLAHHVVGVVSGSPDKQVVYFAAAAGIASMANLRTVRYLTTSEHPCVTVSAVVLMPAVDPASEDAVPVIADRTCPNEASVLGTLESGGEQIITHHPEYTTTGRTPPW